MSPASYVIDRRIAISLSGQVRVVQGEDDVSEAYSLVVRCLERAKHADLRTAIGAIVPKSHSLHGVVTALVEFVLTPVAQNEAALQGPPDARQAA